MRHEPELPKPAADTAFFDLETLGNRLDGSLTAVLFHLPPVSAAA
jgi:hypothetical protein